MKVRYGFLILALTAGLFLAGCGEGRADDAVSKEGLNDVQLHYYKEGYQGLCNEVLERSNNDTLENIQVGSVKENYDKSFFVDIDNDGKEEELRYFSAGNYLYLWDMMEGEQKSPFHPYGRDVYYSGTYIIKINNKFFVLFMSKGPFEVQEFTEISEEESRRDIPISMRKFMLKTHGYRIDLVCKYYDD